MKKQGIKWLLANHVRELSSSLLGTAHPEKNAIDTFGDPLRRVSHRSQDDLPGSGSVDFLSLDADDGLKSEVRDRLRLGGGTLNEPLRCRPCAIHRSLELRVAAAGEAALLIREIPHDQLAVSDSLLL